MDNTAALLCQACEIEIREPPVKHEASSYCCRGCADGGPCCCSYDVPIDREEDMRTLSSTAPDTRDRLDGIPMTEQAFTHLQLELDRLARQLTAEQPVSDFEEAGEDVYVLPAE